MKDYRICDCCGKKMFKGFTSIYLKFLNQPVGKKFKVKAFKCGCGNEVIDDKELKRIEDSFIHNK